MTTLSHNPLPPVSTGFERRALQAAGCMAEEGLFLNTMEAGHASGERADDTISLDQFLGGVQRKAFHVAMGALWDEQTALDVVQESMLRFVEYYREKPPTAWPALFRTVLNSRINDQRRKRLLASTRRKLVSLTGLKLKDAGDDEDLKEADLQAQPHDHGFSHPESDVVAGQLKQAITRALTALPERQRQVFLLREQLGLSIRETAETLGISDNSIKQHHFRALRALRGQLAEVWEHEQP